MHVGIDLLDSSPPAFGTCSGQNADQLLVALPSTGLATSLQSAIRACNASRTCVTGGRFCSDQFLQPAGLRYALGRVAEETTRLSGDTRGYAREGSPPSGRVSDSRALRAAIAEAEARVFCLQADLDALDSADGPVFEPPSEDWLRTCVGSLQELLEPRTQESARVLRQLLGKVELEPVCPEVGRPYYVARTRIDAFALIDPPGSRGGSDGSYGGSGSLRWWRHEGTEPLLLPGSRNDPARLVRVARSAHDRSRVKRRCQRSCARHDEGRRTTGVHLEIVAHVYRASSASSGHGIGSSAANRRRTFSVIRDTSLS